MTPVLPQPAAHREEGGLLALAVDPLRALARFGIGVPVLRGAG